MILRFKDEDTIVITEFSDFIAEESTCIFVPVLEQRPYIVFAGLDDMQVKVIENQIFEHEKIDMTRFKVNPIFITENEFYGFEDEEE